MQIKEILFIIVFFVLNYQINMGAKLQKNALSAKMFSLKRVISDTEQRPNLIIFRYYG